MPLSQFGDMELLHITCNFDAATAVDRDVWVCPALFQAFRLIRVVEIHSVVGGASAALRPRKITDTSAPGAAASSTVIELAAALDLTASANTARTLTLTATDAQRIFLPGNRLALDASGTMTGLVGCHIDFYFEPVTRRL